jgi:hypothetical protein
MRKLLAILVVAFVLQPVSAHAVNGGLSGHHAYDMCKTDWVKSLGVPCETMTTEPRLRCDYDPAVYVTLNYFRIYRNGVWEQWWMYYQTYRSAPRKAC